MVGETVCVTGASGFIGSLLVKRLLERGYFVNATVRDPGNKNKVNHLLELPKAETHLSVWRGEMTDDGSFDEAIQGCSAVFHVASPLQFLSAQDHEKEIIKPTVDGVLNIMTSCLKAKTVKKFIYTSSTAAVLIHPPPPPAEYDESCWTDMDYCYAQKMTGWSYFVAKTKAEKTAFKFAKENGLHLITINPSSVIGPFLCPSMPLSIEYVTAWITGNEAISKVLRIIHAVHVDDLCSAYIFLYEHPHASGRYLCSNHVCSVLDLSKWLNQKYPQCQIPDKFEGVDEFVKVTPCPSKKLVDLGFTFKYDSEKYNVGDLCEEVIEFCKEKGFLTTP